MQFTKATRSKPKLRLALTGPSGRKTYSALLMASGIGGKIAVVDTERSSASLYSHLAEFDALDARPAVHAGTIHRGRAGRWRRRAIAS